MTAFSIYCGFVVFQGVVVLWSIHARTRRFKKHVRYLESLLRDIRDENAIWQRRKTREEIMFIPKTPTVFDPKYREYLTNLDKQMQEDAERERQLVEAQSLLFPHPSRRRSDQHDQD